MSGLGRRIGLAFVCLVVAPRTGFADIAIRIDSVTDLGSEPLDNGWHAFQANGSFPIPPSCTSSSISWWLYPNPQCYGVEVWCNGALEPAQIKFLSPSQITFEIPERPAGSSCSFLVKVAVAQDLPTAAWAPNSIQLASPAIAINATSDLGVDGAQHRYRLTGTFPVGQYSTVGACDGPGWTATTCNGTSCGTWVNTTMANQLDIAFPDPGHAASCWFWVLRSDKAGSAPWYQRVNGSKVGTLPSFIGAYHWGGFEPEAANRGNSLQTAIKRIHDAGITGPVRLVLTPRQRTGLPRAFEDTYDDFSEPNFTTVAACNNASPPLWSGPNFEVDYLPYAACSTRFQNGLNEIANSSTVPLTVIDSTAGGPNGDLNKFVDPTWLCAPDATAPGCFTNGQSNYARVQNEYYRLAKAFLLTQAGTGKTFVVGNWEADNMIFCGNALTFAELFLFGNHKDVLPGTFQNCPNFVDRFNALKNWFSARKAGIAQANADMPNRGVTVADAIEFSYFRLIQGAQVNGVSLAGWGALHGLVPAVQPSYTTYSAWESTGNGRIDQDFTSIAQYLYSISNDKTKPIKFGIGEFGRGNQARCSFTNSACGIDNWVLRENIRAVRRVYFRTQGSAMSPLRFAALWKAFSSTDETDYLLGPEGYETNAMRAVTAGAAAPTNAIDPAIRIGAVREIGPDQSSPDCYAFGRLPRPGGRNATRVFEMYGSFPGNASYDGWGMCSTDSMVDGSVNSNWVRIAIVGRSAGQINVTIPEPAWGPPGAPDDQKVSPNMYCVFRFTNRITGKSSADFGPVLSYSIGGCNPVAI
jgi:hypothetical protein